MKELKLLLGALALTLNVSAFVARHPCHRERLRGMSSQQRLGTVLEMATSSSDLKKGTQGKKKRSAKTVATRLARAAKEAAAAKKEAEKPRSEFHPPKTRKEEREEIPTLSSISVLSKAIDEELLRPQDGYRPPRETSSMRSLLEHNEDAAKAIVSKKTSKRKPECRDVAMVFSKPLWHDQITTEYAGRLSLLARTMKYGDYTPSLICFCGSTRPKENNVVAETSAGVVYFRHLCAANQIPLDDVDICIIDHEDDADVSWSSISSMHPVIEALYRRHHLEHWLEGSEVYESATDEYGMRREEPRKKVHVHFTLISAEYHLCNLNDIHVRSPRQSPLNTMVHELEHSVRSYRGLVETTWCFRYATYPYVDSVDDLTVFLGKCYVLAQKLRPLLVNMRGVSKQEEFFQRDNYRALVATRRSLVTLLEEMNEAFRHNKQRKTTSGLVPPNLKAKLQRKPATKTDGKDHPDSSSRTISVDVALENALLSLGRCADLVRPAGRLTSQSVSREEWKDAIDQLEDFLDIMQKACDPDTALPASQWGQLNEIPKETTASSSEDLVHPSKATISKVFGDEMRSIREMLIEKSTGHDEMES